MTWLLSKGALLVASVGACALPDQDNPSGAGSAAPATAEVKWHPGEWDFRLEAVKLTPKLIVEVRAVLQNVSDRPMMIERAFSEWWVWSGIRIWDKETDGSYALRIRPSLRRNVDGNINFVVVKPGETLSFVWHPGSDDLESTYEFYHLPRRWMDPRIPTNPVTLKTGHEYVVDGWAELYLYKTDSEGRIVGRPESLSVDSSNKLWVTVSQPDGDGKPAPTSAPATQPAAPPDSGPRPAPASPTRKPTDHER